MTSDVLLGPLLRARRFDEALLANADSIRGHFHVSIGLEASAAGLAQVRRDGDFVSTTYRNHAHLAACGADLAVLFAEIFGRDLGPQRGRAGSTHLAAPELGFLHTSAMVSGGVPIALGHAFAATRKGSGAVSFCFFGDGSFGEGGVHECLNLAALWSLPVVFVCENNAAPLPDRANNVQSASSLCAIARAHQVEAEDVDARLPTLVAQTMERVTDIVRTGGGPRFLDAQAGVWPGNQTFFPHDATGPTDLVDATRAHPDDGWRAQDDPVLNECRRLLASGMSLDELLAIDAAVRVEVGDALRSGLSATPPPRHVAFEDVVR